MATIIDANYILRWFLNDNPDQAAEVDELLRSSEVESIVLDRVTIAEVTYVLRSLGYDHKQIAKLIEELLLYPSLASLSDIDQRALKVYCDTTLDFEDCTLIAFNKIKNYKVATFDKKLLKFTD